MSRPDTAIELQRIPGPSSYTNNQPSPTDVPNTQPPPTASSGETQQQLPDTSSGSPDPSDAAVDPVAGARSANGLELGNWIGASAGIGAFIIAIYYGARTLRLQQWSAWKDFRDQCMQAKSMFNSSSVACEKALETFPAPPPFLSTLAKRTLSCLFFQGSCSLEDHIPPLGHAVPLSKRSATQDANKIRTWMPFFIYMSSIGCISLCGLALPRHLRQLNRRLWTAFVTLITLPPCRPLLRALLLLPEVTRETLLFLSCFSPLYAAYFWMTVPYHNNNRKPSGLPSGLWMTFIGGACTVLYVYSWRKAWQVETSIAETEWANDPNRIEGQTPRIPARWHETSISLESTTSVVVSGECEPDLRKRK